VQLYAALCVNVNRYIEQQVSSVSAMVQMVIPITIGTDSLASNTRLSILHELQTIRTFFPDIPIATLLQWATLTGAKALGMEAYLGSSEQGKQPGVLQLTGINIPKNTLHHAQVNRLL
jgi:cytosine/adenosine deaminase-related metal-dependent hydrolase